MADMLAILFDRQTKQPEKFSLTAISYDQERNTGGDILRYEGCIVPSAARSIAKKPEIGALPGVSRNPHHRKHNTINILPGNLNHPVKIHIDLIVEFNGKKVIC